jgi:hypothetical protein
MRPNAMERPIRSVTADELRWMAGRLIEAMRLETETLMHDGMLNVAVALLAQARAMDGRKTDRSR